MNATVNNYFATCPKGLETLLKQELEAIGSSDTRITAAGVYFLADIKLAYKVCLWSRLANKILMPLGKSEVNSAEDLYAVVKSQPWEDHLPVNGSLLVDFLGTNHAIRHTQFGAQTVKDAVVDRMKELTGTRPDVDKISPDIRINARLAKDCVHISLDLSGESLHRRGYRIGQGGAPLKENLAAAILMRANWPEICCGGGALLDPMCGSGTFLLEGAMMALRMAPGLLRARASLNPNAMISDAFGEQWQPRVKGFGFETWKQHDLPVWQTLVDEAEACFAEGQKKNVPEIRGYDINSRALGSTRKNITVAGLDDFIRVTEKAVIDFKMPTHKVLNPGLILCNPPYGERLGEVEALRTTYLELAEVCKREFSGWQLGVFTGNKELGRELRLRAKKKYQLYNGAIPTELLLFDISAVGSIERQHSPAVHLPLKQRPLTSGAEMVANRIRKNARRLGKWALKNDIGCYRVYDADMPEYAAAIDVYKNIAQEEYLHVQEYAAPKSIDPQKAKERFDDLVHACAVVFDLDESRVVTKVRRRNKGKQQYEKLWDSRKEESNAFVVIEDQARLEVNLADYLDTGLFLDHRSLRKRIADSVQGKDFLNLFCYTATATVHAALAGAASSISVDMSNTYLDWAKRNYQLNTIDLAKHQLVRDNCFDWLKRCRQRFDVIMLDPPSFSNSKRMDDVLDIQRDHVALISLCMAILKPDGVLYFSNNLRTFKLDMNELSRFEIKNITAETLDEDFKANPKIHNCWMIKA